MRIATTILRSIAASCAILAFVAAPVVGQHLTNRAAPGPTPPSPSDALRRGTWRAVEEAPQDANDREPAGLMPSETRQVVAKIDRVLEMYSDRHLSAQRHTPWDVMHGIISYGVNAQLWRGAPGSEKVNAIGFVCWNGACRGMSLLYVEGDQIQVRKGPYVQGHHGQLLAILAQSHVKRDYPMRVGGRTFAVADLIESEKLTCRAGTELTFKLIGLAHYLDTDATWKDDRGSDWSISKLITEEIKQPVLHGVACGGTHRLTGLSYPLYKRTKERRPIDGEFARAQKYISDFHRYAFSLQNDDGSFSTAWFQRRAALPDLGRRLQTSGHIFEWIAFSLPSERLSEPKVMRGADYLAQILIDGPNRNWEVGPLGHALHGLAIYKRRVQDGINRGEHLELARKPPARDESSNDAADPTPLSGADRLNQGDETTRHESTGAGTKRARSESLRGRSTSACGWGASGGRCVESQGCRATKRRRPCLIFQGRKRIGRADPFDPLNAGRHPIRLRTLHRPAESRAGIVFPGHRCRRAFDCRDCPNNEPAAAETQAIVSMRALRCRRQLPEKRKRRTMRPAAVRGKEFGTLIGKVVHLWA